MSHEAPFRLQLVDRLRATAQAEEAARIEKSERLPRLTEDLRTIERELRLYLLDLERAIPKDVLKAVQKKHKDRDQRRRDKWARRVRKERGLRLLKPGVLVTKK